MIRILYQDDFLMVLDKPPGLVVTASETQKEPALEDILKSEYQIEIDRGGVVHRLDKDTSGLLVVAKTESALSSLQSQFKSRTVSKQYLALCHGNIKERGKVVAAIGRNPGDREKFVVFDKRDQSLVEVSNVREAVTEYEPIQSLLMNAETMSSVFPFFNKNQQRRFKSSNYEQFTLLRCFPLTGRTHQIRVHLKYIGFPIVGDEKYGGRKTSRLDKRWCPRQFLHAARLEINHPETNERLVFESPLPEDLQKCLSLLTVQTK